MEKTAKGVAPPGKMRPTVFIDSALWAKFRVWAKEQGETLPRALEDALFGAMINQQEEACCSRGRIGEGR